MQLDSYLQLDMELLHLRRLYEMGSFAFANTESLIGYKINQKKINPDSLLSIGNYRLTYTAKEVRSYLNNHSAEYLRELIFIRIISAVEAFFTDTLRDVYMHTHIPFSKQDSHIEFSIGEILSTRSLDELQNKILSRDKRKLNSGLIETDRYYKKVFGVDFNNFGERYKAIKEYYDRRNLFVHSLGRSEDATRLIAKTDKKYKIDYATNKNELDVSEVYLINCINDIKDFSTYVHNKIIAKIAEPEWQDNSDDKVQKNTLCLKIELKEENINEFNPEYKFRVGESIFKLNSFLESIIMNENVVELKLVGWAGALYRYYSIIKKLKRLNKIGKMNCKFDDREWER